MELAIAVLGVVLGALSLGWQGATYVLSGGRVRVELRLGSMDGGVGMFTAPPAKLRGQWWIELAELGFRYPVLAVNVANVGRMPVSITGWSVTSSKGPSLTTHRGQVGPAFPHRLDSGESQLWAMPFEDVQDFVEALRVLPGSRALRVDVELGSGRTKRSRNVLRLGEREDRGESAGRVPPPYS